MALYDGFFDAVLDENTLQYDRTYNSGDFTGYFEETVGSGVCIHENENSFKVSWDGTSAVIAPGYLFIQGYWLKNTDDYAIPLTGQGVHAVLAQLNTGARRIEVDTQPKADPETYPDALVLAYVTIDSTGAATVEDTRYRTDICGVIDSAGGLSSKVEWAINYIDNEIDAKLQEAEAAVDAQAALLDAKIEEVGYMVEKLAPPPIGTVKFSASQDIEEGWLRCDGSFINEADYPELVAALGKHTPGVTEFFDAAQGRIQGGVSNAVPHNGRVWVFSYASKVLYGISFSDPTDIKEISVTGADLLIDPNTYRIWLSICDTAIFISQQISEQIGPGVLLYGNYSFDETASTLALTKIRLAGCHDGAGNLDHSSYYIKNTVIPMVLTVAKNLDSDGVYRYYIACGAYESSSSRLDLAYYYWNEGDLGPINMATGTTSGVAFLEKLIVLSSTTSSSPWSDFSQVVSIPAFSAKYGGECLYTEYNRTSYTRQLISFPSGAYTGNALVGSNTGNHPGSNSAITSVSLSDKSQYVIAKYNISGGVFSADYFDFQKTSGNDLSVSTVSAPHINLTARAQAFPDAGIYLTSQSMWVFFVGTGILFTTDITDTTKYGFLSTVDTIGVIAKFGQLEYDEATNTLILSGQDSTNAAKIGVLKIPTLFDYANDGAWLPMIASDGIPAYINSVEPLPAGMISILGIETETGDLPSTVYGGMNFNDLFRLTLDGEQIVSSDQAIVRSNRINLKMACANDYTCNATYSLTSTSYDIDLKWYVQIGYKGPKDTSPTYESTYVMSKIVQHGDTIKTGDYAETEADISSYANKTLCIKVGTEFTRSGNS